MRFMSIQANSVVFTAPFKRAEQQVALAGQQEIEKFSGLSAL